MNETDKSFMNGAKWWFAVVVILLMGYATVKADAYKYQEDNVTGVYFMMSYDCEVFDPMTGEPLADDNKSKCPLYWYEGGKAIRPATPKQIQESEDEMNRNHRKRMYDE